MNRTQIYLNEFQHDALAELARIRSTTASALIREAIDGYLSAQRSPRERLDALRALSARIPLNPGSKSAGKEFVEELRRADADRLRSLE